MLKKAVTFDRHHILSGRTVNHTMHDKPEPSVRRLHAGLDGRLDGYPRMDPASRALWSTDASRHLRKPAGIVAARPPVPWTPAYTSPAPTSWATTLRPASAPRPRLRPGRDANLPPARNREHRTAGPRCPRTLAGLLRGHPYRPRPGSRHRRRVARDRLLSGTPLSRARPRGPCPASRARSYAPPERSRGRPRRRGSPRSRS